MFPPVVREVLSESSHSKVIVPNVNSAQAATVTVQFRMSVSPAMVVLGGPMETERAGTVENGWEGE